MNFEEKNPNLQGSMENVLCDWQPYLLKGNELSDLLCYRHGCRVAIGSRNSEKINKAAAVLRQGTGGTCIAFQIDVRKVGDIKKF